MEKNEKIFIDCGTHLCEGLNEFIDKGIIDDSFKIYTFEANPECNIFERIKSIPFEIEAHNKAVWIRDGKIIFNQENHKKTQSGSPTDGSSDIDGWASSIDGIGNEYMDEKSENKVEVDCIDFGKFIKSLPDTQIICKMDIEGAEFDVLRHIINDGSIAKISEIYVEFHERYMENETYESKMELFSQITNLGVKMHLWS
jgi:FkbM family methyltransferase